MKLVINVLLKEMSAGVWCGYVTLPVKHPYYQYNKHELDGIIIVHGKISYSNYGTFGFDCGHKGDYKPRKPDNKTKIYWTAEMAKKEVLYLASQFENLE